MIGASPEIQRWLTQFHERDRVTATDLLLKLRFVTTDTYSEWLRTKLSAIGQHPCALYAVRKMIDDQNVWDQSGRITPRPGASLGSEDLVSSVIANFTKSLRANILDHPSIDEIKNRRIHKIVLLDDSIGSGDRVADFMLRMLSNSTLRSWWSFGWIRFHIIAFARTIEAEGVILEAMPGSDDYRRRFPKSRKISYVSHLRYGKSLMHERWGENHQNILNLCRSQKKVPGNFRLGYRATMSNLVFYHSVPNNLPGVVWYDSERWPALFPRRVLPTWLPLLLDDRRLKRTRDARGVVSESMLSVLRLIKKGIRSDHSLSASLGVDTEVLRRMISAARISGFVTGTNRLTESGVRATRMSTDAKNDVARYDRSVYIPKSWCVGRRTVQPFGRDA